MIATRKPAPGRLHRMDVRDARRLRDLVVDCERPASLARFWAVVLRWPPPVWDDEDLADLSRLGIESPEDDPSVFIDSGVDAMPRICFQRVPERKSAKNRLHLEVNVEGEREVEAFVALGATVHSRHEGHDGEHGWVVLLDPEGNEFCAVLLT